MSALVESRDDQVESLSAPSSGSDDAAGAECGESGAQASPAETEGVRLHPCIEEDHNFIREFVPEAGIMTLTHEFVTVVIIRTQYARVQLRVQYLPKYPDEAPIVELTSPTLPVPLLRNKEKECMDKAKENLGKPQVPIIYEVMHSFIQKNLFIPCWKEMKQVATICEGKGKLGADEKEGLLHMQLKTGNYHQGVKLRVPAMYPEEGIQIEFTTSSFPADITYMFKSQAEEIVRRCEAGLSPDQAVQENNPIKMASLKKAETVTKVTASSLKNIKHDVSVLKQISDLRVATTAQKKNVYSVHANAERREARKDLRRLARAESEKDQEEERLMREAEQAEMKALLGLKISDTAQPSLLVVAKFLVEEFAARLPREPCQACKKNVLPDNANDEAITNPRSNMRPMRVFCGHWLHYKCLDDWMCTPPFVRQCPVCDRKISHPDWGDDHKAREKAWMKQEERKREMSDVSDMLGF